MTSSLKSSFCTYSLTQTLDLTTYFQTLTIALLNLKTCLYRFTWHILITSRHRFKCYCHRGGRFSNNILRKLLTDILEYILLTKFSNVFSLTPWGRATHICVSKLTIIGSDNGLSPGRRHAIIWTNAGILLIGTLGTNLREILSEIHTF